MLTVTGGYLNTVAVREVDVVPNPVNGQPLGMVQIPIQYLREVYSTLYLLLDIPLSV